MCVFRLCRKTPAKLICKDMFQDLRDRHEKLKKRIHAFRIPLSPRGQLAMKCVYFSIPLIAGYFIMDAATREAERNKGKFHIGSHPSGSSTHKQGLAEQNQALQAVLNKHKNKDS